MLKDNVIKEVFRQMYDSLTPSQKRLADYIYENQHRVAFMSSAEIANELDISEATVVRFSQTLGFEGYPDLREKLRQNLMREVGYSERVATMVQEPHDQEGTLHEIVTQNIFYLNRLLESITEKDLQNAVDILNRAKRIFIFSEGASESSAYHLAFWLRRLGCNVTIVNKTGRRFYDLIFDATSGDAAIIMAFRRDTKEAYSLLEILTERGGESVLITDLLGSKLHSLSTQVLKVQRGPLEKFRPLGPVTAITDGLTLGLMRKKGDEGIERIRQLDLIRERYGALYS